MALNILVEASGSLVCGYMIDAIRRAGHRAVASDIDDRCVGRYLADDFALMPRVGDVDLWADVEGVLEKYRIDMVIPSLDETLVGWAERKEKFAQTGVIVCLSDADVVRTFSDKWLAHLFFQAHNIPTPDSSLEQIYPLVKPRFGRGGRGVGVVREPVTMDGLMSQEIVSGDEYTVDVLCASDGVPIYIVPRRRLGVREGKSTGGVVERQDSVIEIVRRLCAATRFVGPVNVQCFVQADGSVCVIEVNPRIAGGMALGFAATENWIPLLCDMFYDGRTPTPGPVLYGMRMLRYYAEIFVSAD